MKKTLPSRSLKSLYLLMLAVGFTLAASAENVIVEQRGDLAVLENAAVRVEYHLKNGRFDVVDVAGGKTLVSGAKCQITGHAADRRGATRQWQAQTVADTLGRGRQLEVVSRWADGPAIVQIFALYESGTFLAMSAGIENTTTQMIRVANIQPISEGKAFEGHNVADNFLTLDGYCGWEDTAVRREPTLRCRNNLLAMFGSGDSRRCLILGGLTYNEYEKFVRVRQRDGFIDIQLSAEDPQGKRVDAGVRYVPNDRFYLDMLTVDPFDGLEAYAHALRKAQDIHLNLYNFPTVCLWYARGTGAKNTSVGAVAQADHIAASGILKYTTVAVRLVPDCYNENNQQGWWNDEHWQKPCVPDGTVFTEEAEGFGRYLPPYETSEKWGQAVIERGCIPFTYMQPGIRSQDYADAFPEHMLFNHRRAPMLTGKGEVFYYPKDIDPNKSLIAWKDNRLVLESFDYTDPGFMAHMLDVYENLRRAGIRGIMYDYPNNAWMHNGGFEDKYATTASAYRNIYRLAKMGLGSESWIHERNLHYGSDVALGLVDSQRIWGDTLEISPDMVTRAGLRWYKNRVVTSYDNDSKSLLQVKPANRDGVRAMLTMSYVVTARLLIGNSFNSMRPEHIYDLSRLYPLHPQMRSARPVDAFVREFPQIYDFKVDDNWHQVTFYNTDVEAERQLSVLLSGDRVAGALGLDASASYYVYDFWNDVLAGTFKGSQTLTQTLRPGEARMLSVRKVQDCPQVLSTNRHLMQGVVELANVRWSAKTHVLSGQASVIEKENFKIVIACNGKKPVRLVVESEANAAAGKMYQIDNNLLVIEIESPYNTAVFWQVAF